MRRGPEKNGHDHGASAGNCREAPPGTLDGGMPWSDNPWRDPALVTCEQVGNSGYPETGPTEILEPAVGTPWQEISCRAHPCVWVLGRRCFWDDRRNLMRRF